MVDSFQKTLDFLPNQHPTNILSSFLACHGSFIVARRAFLYEATARNE